MAATPLEVGAVAGALVAWSPVVGWPRPEVSQQVAWRVVARLVVVGSGPEEGRLRALAGPLVEFVRSAPRERLRDLYRNCRSLVLPGVEDFGIVVAEALACGRPAVTNALGGGAEIIENGRFGATFREASPEALARALAEIVPGRFDKLALRQKAESFSRARFEARLRESVERHGGTLTGDGKAA